MNPIAAAAVSRTTPIAITICLTARYFNIPHLQKKTALVFIGKCDEHLLVTEMIASVRSHSLGDFQKYKAFCTIHNDT